MAKLALAFFLVFALMVLAVSARTDSPAASPEAVEGAIQIQTASQAAQGAKDAIKKAGGSSVSWADWFKETIQGVISDLEGKGKGSSGETADSPAGAPESSEEYYGSPYGAPSAY